VVVGIDDDVNVLVMLLGRGCVIIVQIYAFLPQSHSLSIYAFSKAELLCSIEGSVYDDMLCA